MNFEEPNFEIKMLLQLKIYGISLKPFFDYLGVKSIGIYGMSAIGQLIYPELKSYGLDISYCLDRNLMAFKGQDVYNPDRFQDFDKADLIILAVTHYSVFHTELLKNIMEITDVPVYLISEIINFCTFKQIIIPHLKSRTKNKIYFIEYPYLGSFNDLNDLNKFMLSIRKDPSDYAKNPKYFETIYGDVNEYSNEYIKNVFTQSEVICKDGYLRHRDIKSSYVNIINGERMTMHTPESYDENIHIFGACGYLGYGVDDSRTIASQLQKKLNDGIENKKFRVINHSVWGLFLLNHLNALEVVMNKNIDCNDIIIFEHCITFYFIRPNTIKIRDKFLKDSQIEFIETRDYFAEQLNSANLYIDRDHLSYKGMDLVSKALFDTIKQGKNEAYEKNIKPQKFKEDFKINTTCNMDKDIDVYINFLKLEKTNIKGCIGSIVMNCNPLTNGHIYLIEKAASLSDFLYIFVVEEDKSNFPFDDRLDLVKRGTCHIKNLKVLPSGQFIISAKTFPGYFVKDALKDISIDTTLDIEIFCRYISPALDINIRFAGNEPFCAVTRQYNNTMKDILPRYNIEFKIFERMSLGDKIISASLIRQLIKDKNFSKIKELVPQVTFDYIIRHFNKAVM